jgi:hypothetical protein
MKDLFITIAVVFIGLNVSLIVHKVVGYFKLTKEIEFDMYTLEALKTDLEDYIFSKLRVALLWVILLVITIIYF